MYAPVDAPVNSPMQASTPETALLPPDSMQPQAQVTIQVNMSQLEQFLVNPQNFNYIENPLRELSLAPCATVFYRDPCCHKCGIDFCCCHLDCGFTNKYNTFLNTTAGLKYLSQNLAQFNCSICCNNLVGRFDGCKNFGMSSYSQFANGGLFFAEMERNKNCTFGNLCPIEFDVNIKPENRLAGVVKIRGCCEECCSCQCNCNCCCVCLHCYDYYYSCEVLDSLRQPKYQIYLKRCCLSCAKGKCCSMSFIITTNHNKTLPVGTIEGYPTDCCTEGYTYNINFPADATPELKVTLLNAIYAIDSFYLFY